VVLGLVVGGGLVWATVPDSATGVVTACYATSGTSQGVLKVIDAQAGQTCPAGTKRVSLATTQCNGYPRIRVDWHGCDFSRVVLDGMNMDYAKLNGTNLTDAMLGTTSLLGADLRNANLTRARLFDANLNGAHVTGATFSNTYFWGATMNGVVGLTSAQLRGMPLSDEASPDACGNAQSGPQLQSISFRSTNLVGVDLHGAVLVDTNLSSADLTGANLTGALSRGPNFTRTNLTNANLSCSYLDGNFANANLSGANLDRAVLFFDTEQRSGRAYNLGSANLTGVNWNHTTCPDGTNSDDNGDTCVGHL
jgi:uncharacterized protein YjbI with pentapeptide repeats